MFATLCLFRIIISLSTTKIFKFTIFFLLCVDLGLLFIFQPHTIFKLTFYDYQIILDIFAFYKKFFFFKDYYSSLNHTKCLHFLFTIIRFFPFLIILKCILLIIHIKFISH